MVDLSTSVHHLITSGYAFINIDSVLVENAVSAWKQLQRDFHLWPEGFPIIRNGEPEADLGLIVRPQKSGGDYKYFLHVAHDLYLSMTPEQKSLLEKYDHHFAALDALRTHLNEVALTICGTLDKEWGGLFLKPVSENVRLSSVQSRPYIPSTLRSLWYPSAPTQVGAGIHIDRNFFSLHLGDEGGTLFGYDNESGDGAVAITPPPGCAAVFFGVKALYLSGGKIEPLWHGSTVHVGGSRLAMVQFIQADVGFEIPDSKKAYQAFYAVP